VDFYDASLDEQYKIAMNAFNRKNYEKAKQYFGLIAVRHAGDRMAEASQFYLAESNYLSKEYILAIEEYSKLIQSMPQSEYVEEAMFKIGMCYYQLSPGYALDQQYTYEALSNFQHFLEEYPQSDSRPLVQEKMQELRDKLGKKEFKQGELYRKMGYFESAIISFDSVLEHFYDTSWADDALFWKGECYYSMRKWEEAEMAFNQFLGTYKDSEYFSRVRDRLKNLKIKTDDGFQTGSFE